MNTFDFSVKTFDAIESMHHKLQELLQEMPNEMYEGRVSHFLNHLECTMTEVYPLQQELFKEINSRMSND